MRVSRTCPTSTSSSPSRKLITGVAGPVISGSGKGKNPAVIAGAGDGAGEVVVELLGDVAGELEMLLLVLADGQVVA